MTVESERRRRRRGGGISSFVPQAAALALVLADTAYVYAKQGAGPLRPGVDHVALFGWLVHEEVLLAGLCERKILFRLKIYDRLRQATAKLTG